MRGIWQSMQPRLGLTGQGTPARFATARAAGPARPRPEAGEPDGGRQNGDVGGKTGTADKRGRSESRQLAQLAHPSLKLKSTPHSPRPPAGVARPEPSDPPAGFAAGPGRTGGRPRSEPGSISPTSTTRAAVHLDLRGVRPGFRSA